MRELAAEIADRAEGSTDSGALRRLLADGARFGASEADPSGLMLFATAA